MVADPCLSTPCKNGGTCRPGNSSSTYYCDCLTRFAGRHCQDSEYSLKIMPVNRMETTIRTKYNYIPTLAHSR